ncbi:DUF3047 domain-containing protein [Roseomonas sp. AR75]|uniref:DUF3047 domain-containing protein n=1 Tax=Roseomonas sp. AR75 TaxID=2562311 RepID=UPI0010BFF0F6|nr:DUF3047 domain-containing protein [Roseomonas sp. AR75]
MRRAPPVLVVIALAPLLGGAASPGPTAPELEAAGWRKLQWNGIRPANFAATPSGGIRISGRGEASVLAKPLQGAATCLAWRWRVDAGPPSTDLARRGGDDRAVAIGIGFAGFGPQADLSVRIQHAAAQVASGQSRLPRSVLMYVWGGTGMEGQDSPGGFFPSPWNRGIAMLRVQRPAAAPRGRWVEERVNLGADWQAAFGSNAVPAVMEVIVSTDSDDTGTPVEAQVENIRLVPCR